MNFCLQHRNAFSPKAGFEVGEIVIPCSSEMAMLRFTQSRIVKFRFPTLPRDRPCVATPFLFSHKIKAFFHAILAGQKKQMQLRFSENKCKTEEKVNSHISPLNIVRIGKHFFN